MYCRKAFALCAAISLHVFARNSQLSEGGKPVKDNLIREDGTVVIRDARGWFLGEKESSPHAQQEAVMRLAGDTHGYDYYVGISGLAFRMQISKEGFCPSSPHPNCGFECSRAGKLYPWKMQSHRCKPDEPDSVNAIRKEIVASIDRGTTR